jgi:hypothetical protein
VVPVVSLTDAKVKNPSWMRAQALDRAASVRPDRFAGSALPAAAGRPWTTGELCLLPVVNPLRAQGELRPQAGVGVLADGHTSVLALDLLADFDGSVTPVVMNDGTGTSDSTATYDSTVKYDPGTTVWRTPV